MFGARIWNFIKERQLLRKAGNLLLGSPNPSEDTSPAIIAAYRKMWGAIVGAILAWLTTKFGWEFGDVQEEVELVTFMMLTGFFSWLPRNRPQSA